MIKSCSQIANRLFCHYHGSFVLVEFCFYSIHSCVQTLDPFLTPSHFKQQQNRVHGFGSSVCRRFT